MSKMFMFSGVLGFIMLILGIIIKYWIGRRRFNRRTITGAQVFKNYEQAWTTTLGERILRFISVMLIIGGILLILGVFIMQSKYSF